jgi:hypothetical protein
MRRLAMSRLGLEQAGAIRLGLEPTHPLCFFGELRVVRSARARRP